MDDEEAKYPIHLLVQLAWLYDKQEEMLIALFIYGEDTTLISHVRLRTTCMVRPYWQIALQKLEA